MNTLSSLLNFIGNNLKVDTANYVVEQGTSGIWTYRKWSDGTAECWGKDAGKAYTTSAWGNLYYIRTDSVVEYPTGLFIEVPVAQAWFTSVADFVSSPRGLGTVNATPTVLGLRATSISTTAYANYYVIGKWK